MLTNFIQSFAAPPKASTGPVLGMQPAAAGPSSFASTLQSAAPVAVATPQPELPTIVSTAKSAEKKVPDNSKASASAAGTQATSAAPVPDAKLLPVIPMNPVPVLSLPPAITDPVATASLDPPLEVSSHSEPVGSGSKRQSVSIEFQGDALPGNADTAPDPTSRATAVDSGNQIPTGNLASPPDGTAAALIPGNPVGASTPRALSPQGPTESSSLLAQTGVLDLLALAQSSSGAQPLGITGNREPDPSAATPIPGGNSPLRPIDPIHGIAIAAGGANPSSANSKLQASTSVGNETFASASLPASVPFSFDILKPSSGRAVITPKPVATMATADVHAKEVPATQVASTPEGAKSKSADPSANSAEAILTQQPPATVSAPVPVQLNNGTQSASPVTTPSVLAQDATVANPDSVSQSAAGPAAAAQTPAATSPTSLPGAGTVEVARLVAGVEQSEMHIGLRTQAFGSVEVHTVVRDSQVGVTVGSERGDLRTLLANEVSGLQTTFRQQELRFDNIRFLETGSGTTAGFSGGADSQTRSSSQQQSSSAGLFSIHSPPEDTAEFDADAGSPARLNVHA